VKEMRDPGDERAGPCRPGPGPGPGRHAPAPSTQSTQRTVFPLAYHITFGTYGTRLHGDERGTVDRSLNNFGDPIIGRDEDWNRIERGLLRFESRKLTIEQRIFVEQSVPRICARGGWQFIEVAAAPDHVHNMIVAKADGNAVRKWLKRWLSEVLSERWPLRLQEVWWAECGSVKWIWTEDYFERVRHYVRRQGTTE
jgi:REP element-mobilizing transposase RayT